jgi:uncharacterized membrane protein
MAIDPTTEITILGMAVLTYLTRVAGLLSPNMSGAFPHPSKGDCNTFPEPLSSP